MLHKKASCCERLTTFLRNALFKSRTFYLEDWTPRRLKTDEALYPVIEELSQTNTSRKGQYIEGISFDRSLAAIKLFTTAKHTAETAYLWAEKRLYVFPRPESEALEVAGGGFAHHSISQSADDDSALIEVLEGGRRPCLIHTHPDGLKLLDKNKADRVLRLVRGLDQLSARDRKAKEKEVRSQCDQIARDDERVSRAILHLPSMPDILHIQGHPAIRSLVVSAKGVFQIERKALSGAELERIYTREIKNKLTPLLNENKGETPESRAIVARYATLIGAKEVKIEGQDQRG